MAKQEMIANSGASDTPATLSKYEGPGGAITTSEGVFGNRGTSVPREEIVFSKGNHGPVVAPEGYGSSVGAGSYPEGKEQRVVVRIPVAAARI